jgi:hypothetical protein
MTRTGIRFVAHAAAFAVIFATLAACNTAATSQAPEVEFAKRQENPPAQQMQSPAVPQDELYLPNGNVLKGTILHSDARQTWMDTGEKVYVVPRVQGSSVECYSKANWEKRTQGPGPNATSAPVPPPAALASSWYPRHYPSERVEFEAVTFADPIPAEGVLGKEIVKDLRDHPDLLLFAAPRGKIVIQDPEKRYGWHAHSWPAPPGKQDRFHPPGEDPRFVFPLPEKGAEFPDAALFVSAAVDFSNTEGTSKSTSYVPSATESVVIKRDDQADALLRRQTYAGGKPQDTPFGSLWCFSIPKGLSQWYLYTWDVTGKHSEALKEARVGYGEAELLPDYTIDIENEKGALLGRIWVLPALPISADGPAPLPVNLYTGKEKDLGFVATAPVAPRISVQAPQTPPATTATVLMSAYEVAPSVPQSFSVAYGTGKPTAGATLKSRVLETKTADEVVKLDASSTPADQWPLIYWVGVRRTYEHRLTGGMMPQVAPILLPAPNPVKKFRTTIRNAKDAPHLMAIKFMGPRIPPPPTPAGSTSPGIAGGIGSSFMVDALRREAGSISNIVQGGSATAPATGSSSSGDTVQSITNVYVTPVQSPSGFGDRIMGGGGGGMSSPPGGLYFNTAGGPPAGFAPASAYGNGGYPMQPSGSISGGNYYNTQGQQVWNDRQATDQYYSQYGGPAGGGGFNPTFGPNGFNFWSIPVRRR